MLGCHYLQRNDNKGFDFTVTVERHKPHSDGGFKQVDAFRISKDGAQKFYPLKGATHFTITSPWTPREDESKADKSLLDNSDKYRQKYAWNLKFKLKSKVHEPWASSGIFTSVFAFLSCHVRLLFFLSTFPGLFDFVQTRNLQFSGGEKVQMTFQYHSDVTDKNRQIICFAWCNKDNLKTAPTKPPITTTTTASTTTPTEDPAISHLVKRKK